MKYIKMLGLLAVAATALMAFAGIASATTIQSPTGSDLPAGSVIKAQLKAGSVAKLTNSFGAAIECKKSTIEGEITKAGSPTETVEGTVKKEQLTFSECNDHVTVLKGGTLQIHTTGEKADHNGILTATGFEVTTVRTSLNLHCVWTAGPAGFINLGHVTGGGPAVLKASATISRTAGSAFCGSTGTWTAEYEVTSPNPLYVV